MLLNNAKNIMLGSQQVKKIMQGARLVWESVKYYGGIRCDYDNLFVYSGNGYTVPYNVGEPSENYFLTIVDFGEANKRITYGNTAGLVRVYERDPRLLENAVDYWSGSNSGRTVTMIGRYAVFCTSKSQASRMYVHDSSGEYYLKGSEV